MTNKKVTSIVLGVMCLALTAGICVQIRTVKNSNTTISQNYEQNNLRAEVLKYKEKYDNKINEIERLDEQLEVAITKATEKNSNLESAKNQIIEGNKLIGLTEVTGPGVTIVLSDSKLEGTSLLDPSQLVVHDLDILGVINELKNAGAEAISINEERLITTTGIKCGGNIININGEKIGAPFTIKAIGYPETLANLERPNGYLDALREDTIEVKLTKSNNIKIPKYTGVLTYKYATSIE